MVKSFNGSGQILDTVHPEWDLDPHENYLFYKTQNPEDEIRGLWFQNDLHRREFMDAIESAKAALAAHGSDPIVEEWRDFVAADQISEGIHAYSLGAVSAAQAVAHRASVAGKQKRWLGLVEYEPVGTADAFGSEKTDVNTPSTACPTSPGLLSPAMFSQSPRVPIQPHMGDRSDRPTIPFFNFDNSIPYTYGNDGL